MSTKILTKQFNYTKTTKNAIRYDTDGDPHPWAPYQKTFYLSIGEWQRWCDENGHNSEEVPLYLSMDIHMIDIVPGEGGKAPSEKSKSLK